MVTISGSGAYNKVEQGFRRGADGRGIALRISPAAVLEPYRKTMHGNGKGCG